MSITDAEVLADFSAAMGYADIVDDPNAQTLNQLAEMFGCGRKAAQARARKAVRAAKLEKIMVRRQTGSGMREMQAYRVINGR